MPVNDPLTSVTSVAQMAGWKEEAQAVTKLRQRAAQCKSTWMNNNSSENDFKQPDWGQTDVTPREKHTHGAKPLGLEGPCLTPADRKVALTASLCVTGGRSGQKKQKNNLPAAAADGNTCCSSFHWGVKE